MFLASWQQLAFGARWPASAGLLIAAGVTGKVVVACTACEPKLFAVWCHELQPGPEAMMAP
jgi:hypothetical protein